MKSLVTCVVGGCRVRAVSGYKEAGQPRAVSSQQGDVPSLGLAMPYLLVRESFLSTSCTVEGLPLNEARILGTNWTRHHQTCVELKYYLLSIVWPPGEKCCHYPDLRDEKVRRLEFSSSSSLVILNSLEQLGYRVVTSGSFVASQVASSS